MARGAIFVGVLLLGVLLLTEGVRRDTPKKGRGRNGQTRTGKAEQGASTLDPDKFLRRYGYLGKAPGGLQYGPAARNEAIRLFQRIAGLRVTGMLDAATRSKMRAPRCGNPDVVPQGDVVADRGTRKRPGNYYAPGYKWKKNRLTWTLLNYSPDMAAGLQRLAIDDAFKFWSQVAPLDFQEVGGGKADIEFKFGYGEHGDGPGNAFDGNGGVLAHAFYPEDGSTHFDEAERWSWKEEQGTYHLRTVAAHEIGHALGLGHSQVRGALMAPYYQGYDPNFKLHQDDVFAIRSLYGRREPRPTETPTVTPAKPTTPRPTRKPTPKPDSCTVKFDALLYGHDSRIYVFHRQWMWRLNDWAMDPGYPVLTRKVYQRAPINIGAAVYSWRTRYTYFFKGNKIFRYYKFRPVAHKILKQAGAPTNPEAAFLSRDGRIYVLQGAQYWEFDEYAMKMTGQPGSVSSKWPGLPANIEAAVRLRDGYLYLIKGANYRKYDEYRGSVLTGYPKPKAGPFMGPACGGQYIPK